MPFGLDAARLSAFAGSAPSLVLLEELLYAACLQVACKYPWRGAIKGTEIFPNTRGVEEAFDDVWVSLQGNAPELTNSLHLTREVARQFLEARRVWDPEAPFEEPEEQVCNFYFGCPTTTLEGPEIVRLVEGGVLVYHRDHWRPASMGGRIVQLLCAVHNRWKGSSLLLQPDVIYGEVM
jgi:hypothetical protein